MIIKQTQTPEISHAPVTPPFYNQLLRLLTTVYYSLRVSLRMAYVYLTYSLRHAYVCLRLLTYQNLLRRE